LKTVVIIDDDVEYSTELAIAVNENPNFSVVAKAIGSRDGKLYIEHYVPDVIIMDVIMPGDDGIKIIKHLYEDYENYKPYLIVITAVNTSSMQRTLLELDVDFVVFKPVKESRLNDVLGQIASDTERVKKSYVQRKIKRDIADIMEDTLREIGVAPELFGYVCIKTALYFILDNPNKRPQICKEVADILKVSKNSVDMNIHRTINTCTDLELYRNLFGEHPVSNLKFLYGLALYIEKCMRGSENS